MLEAVAAVIVGEGNWLPIAMAIGAIAALTSLRRGRLAAMNLFVGVTLLTMGVGHLLAVTTKLLQGTLGGNPALLYVIGVVIVVPATLLIRHANDSRAGTWNGWMAAALIALGLINIPLAIPALLNIAYCRHSRQRTGQLIIGAWLLINAGLFAGGMMFMLSGARTFEEFSSR
ncbi:MAG TPA: hypothetical protein VEA16_13125 [Vicinamibacterales bacterium]|nr:hypothetical protein [Vicinamibacterales bacterium]